MLCVLSTSQQMGYGLAGFSAGQSKLPFLLDCKALGVFDISPISGVFIEKLGIAPERQIQLVPPFNLQFSHPAKGNESPNPEWQTSTAAVSSTSHHALGGDSVTHIVE